MIFRQKTRTTPAQAVVERRERCLAKDSADGSLWYWEVHVQTAPIWKGTPQKRVYHVVATHDTIAAQEGLRRFSDELDTVEIYV